MDLTCEVVVGSKEEIAKNLNILFLCFSICIKNLRTKASVTLGLPLKQL